MNKIICCVITLLMVGHSGCTNSGISSKAASPSPKTDSDKKNFTLYVSNQSFAQNPVDITIHIDGKKAVSAEFEVADQHNWIEYRFKLTSGHHELVAFSDMGKATMEKIFETNDNQHYWAVVDYWYYPKQSGKRCFSFRISNEPIYFR